MQVDSTQPQDIVADEEKKRVNALLQRENLIRSLGIIAQLSHLQPATETPADMQRSLLTDCKSQVTEEHPDPSCTASAGDSHSQKDGEHGSQALSIPGSVKRDLTQYMGPRGFEQLLTLSIFKRVCWGCSHHCRESLGAPPQKILMFQRTNHNNTAFLDTAVPSTQLSVRDIELLE